MLTSAFSTTSPDTTLGSEKLLWMEPRAAELQGFAFPELEFSVTWKQVALLGSTLEFEKAPSGTGPVTFLRALFKSDLLWFLVQGLLLGGVGSAALLLSDMFGVLAEARIRGAMVTQH